jgi:hypothetical protein
MLDRLLPILLIPLWTYALLIGCISTAQSRRTQALNFQWWMDK